MPEHLDATFIGSVGVSLLLLAFLLNVLKFMRVEGWAYLGLNLVGAGIACWSSWLIRFTPFVVLEGTWAAVALIGIVRKARAAPATP